MVFWKKRRLICFMKLGAACSALCYISVPHLPAPAVGPRCYIFTFYGLRGMLNSILLGAAISVIGCEDRCSPAQSCLHHCHRRGFARRFANARRQGSWSAKAWSHEHVGEVLIWCKWTLSIWAMQSICSCLQLIFSAVFGFVFAILQREGGNWLFGIISLWKGQVLDLKGREPLSESVLFICMLANFKWWGIMR